MFYLFLIFKIKLGKRKLTKPDQQNITAALSGMMDSQKPYMIQ